MKFGISTPGDPKASSAPQLSHSTYATRRKDLLALMNRLRSVGAQAELDLPRIAVIGNQSAGKSSVVEAISGIKVPRESGTCTRCPFECRMSSAPEWACRISIRREFDKAGKRLGDVSEIAFGGVIIDKEVVEMMLRRAQFAALDPGADLTHVLKMSADELKDKVQDGKTPAFSRNVVCIDLEGPDLTDLQFVDLPGIIQNATAQVVRLVEDMVVENIRGNCLILVAIPMTDDIENQKAMTLAREQDPQGIRTIGVLTKPDLISAGSTKSRALWLDVIEGRRHKLHHGYYCTRQPDDEERAKGITVSEARKVEAEFFAGSVGWSTSTEQERFGTDKLISTLSILLVQIIAEKLPTIIQTASTHFDQCRAALADLPEPSTEDPATHLLTLITEFSADIRHIVRGSSEPNALIQKNNLAFGDFKRAIRRTAPTFVATIQPEAGTASPNIIADDEEGEPAPDTEDANSKGPIYLGDVRETLRKARTRELPGDVPPAAKASLIADFQESWGRSTEICFERVRESMMDVLLQRMEQIFSRYGILKTAIRACLFDLRVVHSDDCAKYLEAVLQMETTPMTQNDHYLQATTEKWASKYRDQRAGKETETTASSGKSRKVEKSSERAPSAPSFSFFTPPASVATTSAPSPFGTPALTSAFPVSKAPSLSATTAEPVVSQTEQVDKALALLAQLGYTGLTEEDLAKLRGGDEYETEISLMSGVRAYFQVSYKRVIDNIPGLIDTKFVKTLAQTLQATLIREFKLGQPEAHAKCAEYLTEDPAVVAKRTDLEQRMKMLQGVQKDLVKFTS
ncbi:P-loop containing nucleoside triphosphate hydrolase protein [Mycena maculata]|uniref:P-loop containing nucleoside triphosphate hydrolase protein n=1 Tax=Mycena maculata TaxID=230809 RepID=A0AAD7NLU8_9AGAR|nr:P-loop containing nucleoside triphosphate hydrolase protein [Mycena maculata]